MSYFYTYLGCTRISALAQFVTNSDNLQHN